MRTQNGKMMNGVRLILLGKPGKPGRGRDGRRGPPPAQIRMCATNAYGS